MKVDTAKLELRIAAQLMDSQFQDYVDFKTKQIMSALGVIIRRPRSSAHEGARTISRPTRCRDRAALERAEKTEADPRLVEQRCTPIGGDDSAEYALHRGHLCHSDGTDVKKPVGQHVLHDRGELRAAAKRVVPQIGPFVPGEALMDHVRREYMSREVYMREYMGDLPPIEAEEKEPDGWRQMNSRMRSSNSEFYADFTRRRRLNRPGELITMEKEKNEKEKNPKPPGWSPRHCPKCGHDRGCMCPREDTPHTTTCRHLSLTKINSVHVAMELGVEETQAATNAIYACNDCHQVIFNVASSSLPVVRRNAQKDT